MKVTIVCFGVMRDYLPDPASGTAVVEVEDGSSVADVMSALGAPVALLHACLVNGARASAHERLEEGAEVTLMPPFSGGRES